MLSDGYGALTTKRLVAEANVSERTIFNHFNTLEHIVTSQIGAHLTDMFEGKVLPRGLEISELPAAIDRFLREHIDSPKAESSLERFAMLSIALGDFYETHEKIGNAVMTSLHDQSVTLINHLETDYPQLSIEDSARLALYIFNMSTAISVGMGKAVFSVLCPDTKATSPKNLNLSELEISPILKDLRQGILWAFDQVNIGQPKL